MNKMDMKSTHFGTWSCLYGTKIKDFPYMAVFALIFITLPPYFTLWARAARPSRIVSFSRASLFLNMLVA